MLEKHDKQTVSIQNQQEKNTKKYRSHYYVASWGDQRSSQGGNAWVFPPTKLGPKHVDMA